MRRATPTLPVTPVMLRHFAVLTLVITSCIAIFASGENREFVDHQVQAKSAKTNAAPAQVGKARQPTVISGLNIAAGTQLGGAAGGSDYVERGVSAGEDSGGGGEGGGSGEASGGGESAGFGRTEGPQMAGPMAGMPPGSSPPPSANQNQGPPPGAGPPQKGPPKPQPQRKPTAQEIDRMLAAARERSGSASSE
jgi:hypothetical protein